MVDATERVSASSVPAETAGANHARLSRDPVSHRPIVTVVSDETGETVSQFPPEVVLSVSRIMAALGNLRVDFQV